jgi:flagellar assembly protein FliH
MTHPKYMFDRSFDSEDPTDEEIDVIEETEEEPEIIFPTFSEEEVEAARNEGFEKGKVDAFKEAATNIENQLAKATKEIGAQLDQLTSNQSLANREIFQDAIKVARTITEKLFPSINAENGFLEIENLLHHALGEILEEPRVKIQIHPALTEQLSERLSQISTNTHFEGRVLIIANEAIEQGDCKIEWSSGGALRNVSEIMLEIDTIIKTNLEITDEGYDPDPNTLGDDTIEPHKLTSGQISESLNVSNAQSLTNGIDHADILTDDDNLTIPKQGPQKSFDSTSIPSAEHTKIAQETAIEPHLETDEKLDKKNL